MMSKRKQEALGARDAWAYVYRTRPHTAKEYTIASRQRVAKQHAKISMRRRLTARECLERDWHQAQPAIKGLEQALHDLGIPEDLVTEIAGRLRSQQQLLGKIFGVMFPPCLAVVRTPNCAACEDGIKTCPRGCWVRCLSAPG
jgi:hypothetical protein